jgi:hypothetical protein
VTRFPIIEFESPRMLHPGSVDLDCPNARLQRNRSVPPTGRLPAVNNVEIWVAYVGSH